MYSWRNKLTPHKLILTTLFLTLAASAPAKEKEALPVASGLLAAWNLDAFSSADVTKTASAYLMAPGLINDAAAGILTHSDPYQLRASGNSMASIHSDDATLAKAIDEGNYFKWNLQPEPGYRLTVTSVVFRTDSVSPMISALLSDVSGIDALATAPSGPQRTTVDLSDRTEFTDLRDNIEFRVYGYGTDNPYDRLTMGDNYTSGDGDDILIYGSVVMVGGSASIEVDTSGLSVLEGGEATFRIRLSEDPGENVIVNSSRISGDSNLSVTEGTMLLFGPKNWSEWKTVTVCAEEDADFENSTAVIRCSLDGTTARANITATEEENDISIEFSAHTLNVPEKGTAAIRVRLTQAPKKEITVTVSRETGDADLSVQMPETLKFNRTDWSAWQTVNFRAAEDTDALSGSALFGFHGNDLSSAWLPTTEEEKQLVNRKNTIGPPRKNWRLHALDAVASADTASLRADLMSGTDGSLTSPAETAWIAVHIPALADPAFLTFEADQLISVAAMEAFDSTDGQNGVWSPLPVEIYQPNPGVNRLQKLDIAAGGSRWVRLTVTNSADGAFTLSSLALYQLDPDGWNDYWMLAGASIQESAVYNQTFKHLVKTHYGYDPVIFNVSISGSTAGGVLNRMPNDLARHPHARYICVAGGGNNITPARPYPGGATVLSNDLRGVMQTISDAKRIPILTRLSFRPYPAAPVVDTFNDPASEAYGSGPYVEKIYDPLIAEFCPDFYDREKGRGLVDAYTHFLEHQDELWSDGVHPVASGKAAWNVLWAVDAGEIVYTK